jgi:cytochrome d ubiquinol oxidase subunit II
MQLHTIWFVIIAFFWVGFFVLEGFDFGVGALHAVVGRSESARRVAINTIGPWWDGNEVWLIVAGAAMFAAFPGWYGTMFSALYLALVLMLVALMARGVSFEYRGKRESARWRGTWTWALTIGSVLIPLLIGIGLGDLLNGLPINQHHDYTGSFADLLTGYGVMTGLTLVVLCLLHGSTFLALRTTGHLRDRARAAGRRIGVVAILINLAWVVWTLVVIGGGTVPQPTQIFGMIAVVFAAVLANTDHDGWAFFASAFAIAAAIGQIFIALYPDVMISSTNTANNLTVNNVASGHYPLVVMTVVAVVLLPVVLLYQGWSFRVFRRRVTSPPVPAVPPVAVGAPNLATGATTSSAQSGAGPTMAGGSSESSEPG